MEILSPVGNFESLVAAVSSGADSVYFGLAGFNARIKSDNDNQEDMEKWIDYCHQNAVSVHIAANILVRDDETEDCLNQIVSAYNKGADVIIVQDIGIISLLNELYPQIPIHISTQAGIFCTLGYKFFANNKNIMRVVLSREATKAQIAELSKQIDTEIFCHGALCVAFSGSCYFSSMLCGDSGNRGRCRQLCRTEFTPQLRGKRFDKSYILSTKDICLIDKLKDIELLGVKSLKIEGRLKRFEYVSTTTDCYHRAKNEKVSSTDRDNLKIAFNRGDFTESYMYSSDVMYKYVQSSIGLIVGVVEGFKVNNTVIRSKFELKQGDGFKYTRDRCEVGHGQFIAKQAGSVYKLSAIGNLKCGDMVHLTSRTDIVLPTTAHKWKIELSFFAHKQQQMRLETNFLGHSIVIDGELPQLAKNSPTSVERVVSQLKKVDGMPYELVIAVNMSNDIFIEISKINTMRRELLDRVKQIIITKSKHNIAVKPIRKIDVHLNNILPAYILPTLNNANKFSGEIIYNPVSIDKNYIVRYKEVASQAYISLPYFLREDDIALIEPMLKYFKGVYCNNPYAVTLALRNNKQAFIGDMNIFSSSAVEYATQFSNKITLSKELSGEQIIKMRAHGAYVFAYGDTTLMQLNHCVAKNITGCDCSNCKYDSSLFYVDRKGSKFPVVRYKYKNCYFVVYNSIKQNAVKWVMDNNFQPIYNLSLATDQMQLDFANGTVDVDDIYTFGHIKRGVK